MSEKKDIISNYINNENITNSNPAESGKNLFVSKKIISDGKLEKENPNQFLNKKIARFKVEKEVENTNNKSPDNMDSNDGRWSKEEHEKVIEGIIQFGINWKKVKTLINTRTPVQVRSHAQKFYQKLKKIKDDNLGIDFTSDSISNIKDMVNHIKLVNQNYSVKNMLLYLGNKCDNIKKIKILNNKKGEINKQNNNNDNLYKIKMIDSSINTPIPLNNIFSNDKNTINNNNENLINNNFLNNPIPLDSNFINNLINNNLNNNITNNINNLNNNYNG